MKDLTVCLLLFITIICLCFLGAFYITNHVVQAEQLIQNAMDAYTIGDIEAAQHIIDQAMKSWTNCRISFGILICHEDFDAIQTDLSTLKFYKQQDDQSDFCSLCSSLLSRLRHIREIEWPYLFNIL